MMRVSTLGRLLLAGGVSGAAVIGLATHAFVRNWEPVPAGLPLYGTAAWMSDLLLLAWGAGLLVPRAALLEATMMSAFVLAVDIPRFLAGRVHGPPWAIAFETAMTGAVWCVAGSLHRDPARERQDVPGTTPI